MNNQEFRKLVLENSTPRNQNGATPSAKPSATPFGAKARGFMTPRHSKDTSSSDFRRQLVEQAAGKNKKFRSSAAPKGTKLASGYRDRTQDRKDEDDDDKGKRIKALEEQMKLGQIDQVTFEQLRDQITGGDISSTHLVKGLDRRLLERIKRGEDVLNSPAEQELVDAEVQDVDEALEQLEDEEIAPTMREKTVKKGEMAPPPVSGAKRNRDTLLAELRAQRQAAAEAKATSNSKFRKIGDKQGSSRLEIDAKGREVMIVTDADGNTKRRVRKAKIEDVEELDSNSEILGADVAIPEQPPAPVIEDHEEDMFAGAGDDYNPFGNVAEDDSSSEDEGEVADAKAIGGSSKASPPVRTDRSPPSGDPVLSKPQPRPRNYFDDEPADDQQNRTFNPLQDPTILAALRKSRDTAKESKIDPEEEARQKKRAAMLASSNRDFEDMDMGFGSSKFADEEDMEEGDHIKLSEWGQDGDDDDQTRGGKKRKRGPKKKKGDKNNAADIMKVMEGRKTK